MEPPRKRKRVFSSDTLDPDDDFLKARNQNDFRLKSTFESIFEKYSKDFSTVGDEIDLETGEIVINNGHLRKMRDEQDAGKLLNMLMAAPGDYDDLGDYEAEEIERKAILAIPELEAFFADSHSKENAGGAWTAIEENRASLLDSGLEETLLLETNVDGSTLSSSPSELPSSTDILRQFGTNLGPRIIQYVAHLQAGSNSKVEPFWHTPALPQPPSEKANVVQSIQNPLPQDRASSPTVHSIWGSEGTKAKAKQKHLRSATDHANKNAQKSTEAIPSKDLQCAPLEPLQNGVLDYSPNTRRKLKGAFNTTVAEIERKLDDGLDDSLECEKPPKDKQPESAVHQKEVASDQHPVPNVRLRRSARLSSTSDVILDIEYSKSPMKAAFVAAGQGRQPDEIRIFPSEGSKGDALHEGDRDQRTSPKERIDSGGVCTPSRKCTPTAVKGQSTPVSSLLRPRHRKRDLSISPSRTRSTRYARTGCSPSGPVHNYGMDSSERPAVHHAQSSPRTPTFPTPNGTLRKCGEMGFRCSKDFCMKCI